MPRRADLACSDCGVLMVRGEASLPDGQARCHPCRRSRPRYVVQCAWCGEEFAALKQRRRFCSRTCSARWAGALRRNAHKEAWRLSRAQRESAAPGLPKTQREHLLAKWKRRGVLCAYCVEALADTIDHVVPLILGGTNFEGNLAPACRRCNSSKSYRLLAEWRLAA